MNGLEEEYAGVLECEVLDATTAENKAKIQSYGFGTHGMVFFDENGSLAKKLDGHKMQEPLIRTALKEVMGGADVTGLVRVLGRTEPQLPVSLCQAERKGPVSTCPDGRRLQATKTALSRN